MSRREDFFRFVNSSQAVLLQRKLAEQVRSSDDPNFRPRYVCGMDVAYEGKTGFATAATFDLDEQVIVDIDKFVGKVRVEYLSGFLGFREGPILLKLAKKLRPRPDVYLIDGHGRSHPRRFGIACHIGIALDKPTIGVAKSFLYGKIIGDNIYEPQGEIIGRILTSSIGRKFFVSVGHRISLDTATRIVLLTLQDGHPMPLRRAHLDSIILKREGK